MSQINRAAVEVWKMRFRRLYTGVGGADTLAALTSDWASEAAESVTFTSTSLEGGSAAGVVTGNRLELLMAAEELLADPMFLAGFTQPAPRLVLPDYSLCRP